MAFKIVHNNKKYKTILSDWIDLFEAVTGINKRVKFDLVKVG
jgi:hypothetical protein